MTDKRRALASYFKTITCNNGDTRVTFTDDIPEWLYDACGQAMHHCMSDWAYEACKAVAREIDENRFEGRDYQDTIHEWADSYVDIYTKDLAQWYALHCLTDIYSHGESEAEDLGLSEKNDINQRLMAIQFFALQYLASCIVEAWRQHNEDMGDEDQESADDDYAAVAEKDNATHEKDICPCNACHDERQGT